MSTMTGQGVHHHQGGVATRLRANRLGTFNVMTFQLAAVAPLLVVAGVIPTYFAVTGLTGAPLYFVGVGLVLAVFSVGYVAMARQIQNAGACYAYVRSGLGRPLGLSAALVAILAYFMLQIGLFGLFGPSMSDWASTYLHLRLPWYLWSLAAWAVVMVLGLREVGISAKVLAPLSVVEVGIIVVIALAALRGHAFATSALSPASLSAPGAAGAGVAMAVLGFVGFEVAPVFGEEARNHRRTVPLAIYITLFGIIGVYVLSSLAMLSHYGIDRVGTVAAQQGPEMWLSLIGGPVGFIVRLLFLTSMFAGLLAFQAAVGRYLYPLGREQALPGFGRVGVRSGSPWVASLTQSALALVVILLYAAMHWDPLVNLFFWFGSTGGFGILALLTATSIAVVFYFLRDTHGEPLWRRFIAPVLSSILLAAFVFLAVRNYATLLGIPEGAWAARLLPGSYLVPTAVGLVWASILRAGRPETYHQLGLGAQAVEVGR
jgi:amino acid transporter